MNIRFYGKHIDKDIKNPEFVNRVKGFQESKIHQNTNTNHLQTVDFDQSSVDKPMNSDQSGMKHSQQNVNNMSLHQNKMNKNSLIHDVQVLKYRMMLLK